MAHEQKGLSGSSRRGEGRGGLSSLSCISKAERCAEQETAALQVPRCSKGSWVTQTVRCPRWGCVRFQCSLILTSLHSQPSQHHLGTVRLPTCPLESPELPPTAAIGCLLQKQKRESLTEMGRIRTRLGPAVRDAECGLRG